MNTYRKIILMFSVFFILQEVQSHREENYFKMLGITKGAIKRDVRLAYRALAKKIHPDKNKVCLV